MSNLCHSNHFFECKGIGEISMHPVLRVPVCPACSKFFDKMLAEILYTNGPVDERVERANAILLRRTAETMGGSTECSLEAQEIFKSALRFLATAADEKKARGSHVRA